MEFYPSKEEVAFTEKDIGLYEEESEEDADYGPPDFDYGPRDFLYEEELREEEREESFITPGKTSEEDVLDTYAEYEEELREEEREEESFITEEIAFAEKDREAYAQHMFENGEIPYEVAYAEYVEDLREKLLIPSKEEVAYAEYEEELREEEREEESFITPGDEFEYADYEAEYEYEEDILSIHAYAEYMEGLKAELRYREAYDMTSEYVEKLRAELRYREVIDYAVGKGGVEDEMTSEEEDELIYREAYAEHEGESEEYAEYETYSDVEAHELREEKKEESFIIPDDDYEAEYEHEEEEREESFITPGKTSEKDVLDTYTEYEEKLIEEEREEESFITPDDDYEAEYEYNEGEREDAYAEYEEELREKDREAYAQHKFENGEISHIPSKEELRDLFPFLFKSTYAEYEEELRDEEKEEESFITPDEEIEYADYEAEYEYEEDILSIHAYAEYVEGLKAELRYREAYAEDDMTSEYVEELRAELQYIGAYAEYQEELEEEEREEESFITPGKTSEEDVLELHTREHTVYRYICVFILLHLFMYTNKC
jgi:hypothetical protein